MPSFAPKVYSLLNQTSFGVVPRRQLGLAIGDVRKVAFERLGDAGVKRTAMLAQQAAISRVLHQGMFEEIACVRQNTLTK